LRSGISAPHFNGFLFPSPFPIRRSPNDTRRPAEGASNQLDAMQSIPNLSCYPASDQEQREEHDRPTLLQKLPTVVEDPVCLLASEQQRGENRERRGARPL
jgi:hypothetical protein